MFNEKELAVLSCCSFGICFLGRVADLNVVIHRYGASRLSHSGGGAFMLNDIGIAFDSRNPALHLKPEFLGADLRLHQLGPDGSFDLYVRVAGRRTGLRGRGPLVRGRGMLLSGEREDYHKRSERRGKWIVSHGKEVGGRADFLTYSVLE